ncbi:hypothetical protein G7092_29850 [Mucilaginibacter sp. HC2]|uniref:phage exclusion protein Lit family protein n=1 Tax=Mucilaginibacter inviolabilis TaxID=2714892 RepID=UPI00140731C8|nr:phage exclusion protein Lit family protein [Mucilaginibacter inviolabilis]NHA08042.1 hypothetical protein [Mucilaginibacter inviolabilis]
MEESETNKYYISSLYGHIDEAFRNGNEEIAIKISALISTGRIKSLELNEDMFPMKGPFSHLSTGIIVLQAGFLSYLWTVCYFMIGLIEIYQDKAGSNQRVISLVDSEKFNILNYTFAWGRSLKPSSDEDFNPWPDDIANPTQEDTRVKQANHLLVLAASYLMYHELGHLVLHADSEDFIKSTNKWDYERNSTDSRRLRIMEIQADIYALDCMFSNTRDEHDRYMKFLASIIAQLAEFFIRRAPDTRSQNYPDLDERLKRILNKVDIEDLGFKMNIDLTCSIGLQLFLTLTYADFIPPNPENFLFENFDDLKIYLFNIIQAWKDKYNSYKS